MNSIPSAPSRTFRFVCFIGLVLIAAAAAFGQATGSAYLFTHLAGPLGGPGSADGPGQIARFNNPLVMTTDRSGNVYVADKDNHNIRKITPAGVVTTLTAPDGTVLLFSNPSGLAVDSAGNVIVSDANRDTVHRITPAGVMTVLAGATYSHYNYQTGKFTSETTGQMIDANGTDARFFGPMGLAADNAGNVYVADSSNRTIRKITATGDVTTVAGSPTGSGGVTVRNYPGGLNSVDGTGPAAQFSGPVAVALDGTGNLYVADSFDATIRRVTPGGAVSTVAGSAGQYGSADGTGANARFSSPNGVTTDTAGTIYVTDNDTIRQITPAGNVTTLAGAAGQEGAINGTGANARFKNPASLAADSTGNLYVADPGNFTIRKISPGAVVSTFAGVFGGFGNVDGTGAAARFYFPQGIAVDSQGTVYVADFYNHAIRKVTPGGVVSTLASKTVGTSINATLYNPSGMAVDRAGNAYVANAGSNSILKITPAGVVTTFAGPSSPNPMIFGHADGAAANATFAYPEGITIDNTDTLYVADSGNSIIRKITPDGTVSTLAGVAGQSGSTDGAGAAARFNSPLAVAVDGAGNVYVADTHNHTIRKITPNGTVTTLAGVAGQTGSADGNGNAALFSNPCGVAVDGAGNVFVGDANNLTIRKITPGGTVSTLAGKANFVGSADGIGHAADFYYPSNIAVDSAGTLYVADEFNHAIRKGQIAGPPVITTQPASQTVATGGTIQFSVTASGVPDPTYQWYFNGGSFSGATGTTLSFTNARTTDAGDYTVVVTNELGSVISNKATLTIGSTPVTPPPPASGGSGGGGAIEGWFVFSALSLSALRCLLRDRRGLNFRCAE